MYAISELSAPAPFEPSAVALNENRDAAGSAYDPTFGGGVGDGKMVP